ncbi:hypothetical protein EV426DRAFT_576933 [Tirmania nivea]|nr:hypothetical protein EV426DRAFT_576933 [Tirmania nivea]
MDSGPSSPSIPTISHSPFTMASGRRPSPPSIPTRNEMLTLIDLFELNDVRSALDLYWPYDDDYLEKQSERERETHERERLGKEIERLKCQSAKMLKMMQDMAKKSEHAKAEMDEIVEALRAADCQWNDHKRAKQQAIALQQFLG